MRDVESGPIALFGSFSRRGVARIEADYLAVVLAGGVGKLLVAAEGRRCVRPPAAIERVREALILAEYEARRAFVGLVTPARISRGFRALHDLANRWVRGCGRRPLPAMTAVECAAYAEARLFQHDLNMLGVLIGCVDPATGQLPLSALGCLLRLDRAGNEAARSAHPTGLPRQRRKAA